MAKISVRQQSVDFLLPVGRLTKVSHPLISEQNFLLLPAAYSKPIAAGSSCVKCAGTLTVRDVQSLVNKHLHMDYTIQNYSSFYSLDLEHMTGTPSMTFCNLIGTA